MLATFNLGVPDSVTVTASDVTGTGLPENDAHISMRWETGAVGHIHVSWLSPVKIRRTVVMGTTRTVVYDDLEPDAKLHVYQTAFQTVGQHDQMMVNYRRGETRIPWLPQEEALRLELEDFRDCILTGRAPVSSSEIALATMRLLGACDLAKHGHVVV
jgi:predicted dehydrogenase